MLVDRCWCLNTNSNCYSDGGDGREQINPRLIAPSWAVLVWECAWVCVCFISALLFARCCTTLCRQRTRTQKKSLVSANWSPALSPHHTQTGFGVMSYSFGFADIIQVNAKQCSSLLPVSVSSLIALLYLLVSTPLGYINTSRDGDLLAMCAHRL